MLSYLNQIASFEACTRDLTGQIVTDEYGQPIYQNSVNIRVRQSPIHEEFRNERGQSIIAKIEFYTMAFVQPNDLLNGQKVIHVEPYYGFSGNRIGVRCLV